MDIIEKLLKNKTVSVWGGGYLGYTTIIRLQAAGFIVNLFDFGKNRIYGLQDGSFPNQVQKESWTASGELPVINPARLNICTEANEMFSSQLHIISFPAVEIKGRNLLVELEQIITKNIDRLKDPLFIFQSAEIPGTIENGFIKRIEKNSLDWSYASAFRSDWTVEEFIANTKIQVIAGYDEKSLGKAKKLFDLLKINYIALSSIEEAEIFENARKSVKFVLSAFFNQLALSYPSIDIRKMTNLLIDNINERENFLSIGSLKYQIANSIDHLMSGIKAENYLSILKDAESGNISILFKYADLIRKKGIKTVCIFGISSKNTYKDIRFSPSVILAEYLNKCGIKVVIDDPHYERDEILKIFPFAQYVNIDTDRLESEALFIFRAHENYNFLSQQDLDEKGLSRAQIVIDDVGVFQNFKFSEHTIYHIPGDGNLGRLY